MNQHILFTKVQDYYADLVRQLGTAEKSISSYIWRLTAGNGRSKSVLSFVQRPWQAFGSG